MNIPITSDILVMTVVKEKLELYITVCIIMVMGCKPTDLTLLDMFFLLSLIFFLFHLIFYQSTPLTGLLDFCVKFCQSCLQNKRFIAQCLQNIYKALTL